MRTHLLCLAGGCQGQHVVGMGRVPVAQTKPAGGDLAEGAVEAELLAGVLQAARVVGAGDAAGGFAASTAGQPGAHPAALGGAQVVRGQGAAFRVAGFPAALAVEDLPIKWIRLNETITKIRQTRTSCL